MNSIANVILCSLALLNAGSETTASPFTPKGFPAAVQFSPVPSGAGWKSKEEPLTPELIGQSLDNYIAHGFIGLELPTRRPPEEEAQIRTAAIARGMFFTYNAGGLEGFGRDAPPAPCVYSPEYHAALVERVDAAVKEIAAIPNIYNVFTYQDEPFHGGLKSLCLCALCRERFRASHGWALPEDISELKSDPARFREYLDFATMNFPDAWQQVYSEIKRSNAPLRVTMTHDSHNTFGAGAGSHAEIAIDDVGHWGGQFADLFVYDIYPYINFDYRYGVPAAHAETPRMSQLHYSFSQMRALTYGANKQLGFWLGTYASAWFKPFLNEERRAQKHFEAEVAFTAVAQGADYLLTGYEVPEDTTHWETLGRAMSTLQKAPDLVGMRRPAAKVAVIFPRTNYLMTQREYFNVGISFELIQRAFGECDILHEDDLVSKGTGNYAALALFDCEYLSRRAAERLAAFVEGGGLLLADCVPAKDENGAAMDTLLKVFGVSASPCNRLAQSGHLVPYADRKPEWPFRDPAWKEPDYSTEDTVSAEGVALPLVSVRRFTATDAEVVLSTQSGAPAMARKKSGKGTAVLYGFCVQDTWFAAWLHKAPTDVAALERVTARVFTDAGVQPGVHSANSDIEVAVRAGERSAYVVAINHEATSPRTEVTIRGLAFTPGAVTDIASGHPVETSFDTDGGLHFSVEVSLDGPRLFSIAAK